MKMNREHRVPLSDQLIKLIEKLKLITGNSEYLFPCYYDPKKPTNSQSINQIIKRIGFKDRLVSHGFRAMASTYFYEKGYKSEVIESCLAHVFGNQTVQAYNRGDFFKLRIKLMNDWSEFVSKQYEKFETITSSIYCDLESNEPDGDKESS